MKVCFLLHHPGDVRYFDSVFDELLRHGHNSHSAFAREIYSGS